MKKLSICAALLCAGAVAGFAQTPSIEDAYKALSENFAKFPYAHLIAAEVTDDNRMGRPVKLNRFPYFKGEDVTGEPLPAEMIYVEIVSDGLRFNVQIDFVTKHEAKAKTSKSIKGQVDRLMRPLGDKWGAKE